MTKYNSKSTLLDDIRAEHRRLENNLTAFSPEDKHMDGVVGEWSIKDVMAHLTDWEQRFVGWYRSGKQGGMPQTPAPGLSWSQLDDLNQQIYEKHKDCSLEEVQAQFDASYREVLELVEGMSEEELFTPGYYAWNEHEILAGWAAANTCNHYYWAKTQIRKTMKKRGLV